MFGAKVCCPCPHAHGMRRMRCRNDNGSLTVRPQMASLRTIWQLIACAPARHSPDWGVMEVAFLPQRPAPAPQSANPSLRERC